MNKFLRLSVFASLVLLGTQCTTVEKAPLESRSMGDAAQEVANLAGKLQSKQVDFLAHEEFNAGTEDLQEAREDMKEGDEKEEVMESLGMAKAHFLEAEKKAMSRKGRVNSSILTARKQAISNGLPTTELNEKLSEIDHDYRDETDTFTDELSVDESSTFQTRYNKLETSAVVARETGQIESVIESAVSQDAEDLASNTLKDARTDLASAVNQIQHNPRDPSNYKEQVMEANRSAKLLKDVMNKLTGPAKGSPEHVARQLVFNDRKIGKLSSTLNTVEGNLKETRSNLIDTSKTLLSTKEKLAYEQTMEKIRKKIPESQAEAYVQGEKMIIRLKNIDFPVGSAKIPNDAKQLITNIQSTLKGLDPKSVEIQGHTDSQGSSEMNKKLSMKRAEAVSALMATNNPNYELTTKGFGENQPLVSNNTKKGRRTNRRVDLVVSTQ